MTKIIYHCYMAKLKICFFYVQLSGHIFLVLR